MPTLTTPPDSFRATRDSLRALACYVIAPFRKARMGRIGLRPTGDGFGTPAFDDGTRVIVRGDRLLVEPERSTPITTLRAAAAFVGVDLSDDPGVGRDIPPFTPHADLAVDASASLALGAWYRFGQRQLDRLDGADLADDVSDMQLWPEHFDLAVTVDLAAGATTIGFSPGDAYEPEPYVYVGPHDREGLAGSYWNAPFGAILTHTQLRSTRDADDLAAAFIENGLHLLQARPIAR